MSGVAGATEPLPREPSDTLPTSEQAQAAEQEYERGAQAFRDKRYMEAIDKFNRANTLRPDSRLYFNIGLAFDRAGDVSNALSNYRSYVFEERDNQHTERVALRVAELERELSKKGVQQVTIRSTPSVAQVAIDGQNVGATPWTADLVPGSYRVTLTHGGFEATHLEFSLSLEAAVTLSATLEPLAKVSGVGSFVATPDVTASARHPDLEGAASKRLVSDNVESRDESEPEGTERSVWPWIAVGTGTALGLAAVGFELDRRDAVSDARIATSRSSFDENLERMQRDQTLARVFGTVAATGVVVGVIWLLAPSDSSDERGDDRVSYACGPSGCNWGLRF